MARPYAVPWGVCRPRSCPAIPRAGTLATPGVGRVHKAALWAKSDTAGWRYISRSDTGFAHSPLPLFASAHAHRFAPATPTRSRLIERVPSGRRDGEPSEG